MFTGLIETVGRVTKVNRTGGGSRLRIRTSLASELAPGDSLEGDVHADIGPETARVTTLGSIERDQDVNLERPMRADSRFGGHFVLGHVDGTGMVEEIRAEGDAHWVTISFGDELARYLIRKGSVAVDGISLTVADLRDSRFDVMIVPFTWEHTTLPALRVGARVNLECDMVGKYVARAAEVAGRL
jgi:riboflavin synthase